MNYWLVKTEPSDWSWADHVKAGTTAWTGVKNPQAQQNLRAMQKGDRVFVYHTGDQKQIVGIAQVVRAAYPDPTDKSGKLVAVDLKALKPVKTPVTLAQVKADPRLANLALVKNSRLSVMPIDAAAWRQIGTMAGLKT